MSSQARRKRPRSVSSLAAAYLVLLLDRCGPALCYFADWSAISQERFDDEPTCVPIPRNLSLCHGIGYTKVRTISSSGLCEIVCSVHLTMTETDNSTKLRSETSWVTTHVWLVLNFQPQCQAG